MHESLGNVEGDEVSPAGYLVAVFVQECHARLQTALEHALVIFEQEHHYAPDYHTHPGESLKTVWDKWQFSCFLETLG